MLIFSVSFQFFRMHPRREQLLLAIYGRPKHNFVFCSSRECDCGWPGRVTLRVPRRGGTQVTPERTLDPSHRVMSSYDIAEKIRESLPGTEEIIVQYLSGYLVDEASEDEDILQVARYMLESVAVDKPDVLEQLMGTLSTLLQDQLALREKAQSGPKLQRLDKVLDMSKTGAMSNTIALSEGVDLESINKGKCVRGIRSSLVLDLMDCVSRASRVDVKKLEKQEAKLKAKIEKRARRDLYEGSKLLEQAKKQVRLQLSFHLPRVSDIVWPKAILRGNVHEGALGSFPTCHSFMLVWWNRSTPCNPQRPRKTQARIFISRPSTSPLARTVSCAYPLHHCLIWPLTSLQLWGIPHTCIWQTLWNHRPQWRRKVNSPPAYRHARGSYSLTHHHPLR